MELVERVGALESDVKHLQADMTEVKADVKHLQADMTEVKADVKALRTDVHGLIKWIVGTAAGVSVAAITVMTFVLNNAVPKAAPVAPPSPIIINIPAQPAAVKPE